MSTLRWDDVEVRFSVRSHKTFKASPCGFLLPMTPGNKDEMLAKFRPQGAFGAYSGLWVSGIADLGFLQEFPDLRNLEVVDQTRVDARQLECLRNLRGLRIDAPGAGIDFSWFPELELFVGDWHVDNCNLSVIVANSAHSGSGSSSHGRQTFRTLPMSRGWNRWTSLKQTSRRSVA